MSKQENAKSVEAEQEELEPQEGAAKDQGDKLAPHSSGEGDQR